MSPGRMGKTSLPLLINMPDKLAAKKHLTIAGIDCIVERKNIRRLHLYVKPPYGEVLVTVPFLYTEREIKSFVESKADWIKKHQKRMSEKPDQAKMALGYVSGETLYFWGKPYELTVAEDPGIKRGKLILEPEPVFGVSDVQLNSYRYKDSFYSAADISEADIPDNGKCGRALLIVPAGNTYEQREHIIKKKYKELLEQEAGRVLGFWSEQTGLRFSEWHSRYMKSRWGSLSVRDKRVCLNTRLAEKPEICLIYVALHEIAHVREPNHGPRFKAILNDNMPDWRETEKMLKH